VPLRLAIDVLERPLALFVRARAAELQRFEVEANLRERRAQLVRDARHESRLQARELSFAAQLHHGDDGERGGKAEQSEQEWKS